MEVCGCPFGFFECVDVFLPHLKPVSCGHEWHTYKLILRGMYFYLGVCYLGTCNAKEVSAKDFPENRRLAPSRMLHYPRNESGEVGFPPEVH